MRWKQEIAGLMGLVLLLSASTVWAAPRDDANPPPSEVWGRPQARADHKPGPRLENNQNWDRYHHDRREVRRDNDANQWRRDFHRFENRPLYYRSNWHRPGPPPYAWHPYPPPGWHSWWGYPVEVYPPRVYYRYVTPILISPYSGYYAGDAVAGTLLVDTIVKAILAASEPAAPDNSRY